MARCRSEISASAGAASNPPFEPVPARRNSAASSVLETSGWSAAWYFRVLEAAAGEPARSTSRRAPSTAEAIKRERERLVDLDHDATPSGTPTVVASVLGDREELGAST